MRQFLTFLTLVLCTFSLAAQETFPYNGVSDHRDGLYAFTNATIFQDASSRLDNATLVIQKGKILAVGVGVRIPPDAVVIDATGKTIYPAFIDLFSDYGQPEPKPEGKRPDAQPQMLSNKKGAYGWNEAIKSEYRAAENFNAHQKDSKIYRDLGFATVLSHRKDGISRGSAALVTTGEAREHELILLADAAHVMSFQKGTSTQSYPNSLMGSIALIRQTYLDAAWYKDGPKDQEGVNLTLEAWNKFQDLPQVFDAGDKLNALRSAKIAGEFGKKYLLKVDETMYQRLDAIKACGMPLIVSVDFPAAYEVSDPLEAMHISLDDLKHWEMAPANLAMLEKAGIEFALTADGLEKKSDFLPNLRKAIQYGLSETTALKALTSIPAKWIRAENQLGSLRAEKIASFIITDGNIFDSKSQIQQIWVKGQPFVQSDLEVVDLSGRYELKAGDAKYNLLVKGKPQEPDMVIQLTDSSEIKVKSQFSSKVRSIELSFAPEKDAGLLRLSGIVEDTGWRGKGQLPTGAWVDWSARLVGPLQDTSAKRDTTKEEIPEKTVLGKIPYPFLAYGWTEKPAQETVLLKGATVWTNEEEGILEKADVLIKEGKIAAIGANLAVPAGAKTVDCMGKHLTSGIIDEHTHIAISRGVNEGSQSSSAEVRIGDVINSDDINIYRQLSGGVTAAQQLHGSANPIGGQSAIIKLRWGFAPEEMKVEGADGFIKFALGENVKQSNWGDDNRIRFPQTRMGVEQVFVDYFTRAREYGAAKSSGKPFRKDLELEALWEILEKKRFITCHSYRQSEINMLMKVAEQFGFRVNTFTHILEGYKVADIMAAHGAGGSTFSDWWAYKFEVYDAIPYNGALMHRQGVTVAYNSDDAEMARRLNQEAAKAVKYGNVPEEEAWKFVTLNPAKLLHLDDRMGSIKVGKDADLVLWSDHPMSIYAKAEQTYVDGRKMFDRQLDLQLRREVETERNRIIQKMLNDNKKGGKTQAASKRYHHLYHCDDLEEEMDEAGLGHH